MRNATKRKKRQNLRPQVPVTHSPFSQQMLRLKQRFLNTDCIHGMPYSEHNMNLESFWVPGCLSRNFETAQLTNFALRHMFGLITRPNLHTFFLWKHTLEPLSSVLRNIWNNSCTTVSSYYVSYKNWRICISYGWVNFSVKNFLCPNEGEIPKSPRWAPSHFTCLSERENTALKFAYWPWARLISTDN